MKIDIYQSNANKTMFLTVPAGSDITKLSIPDTDYVSVSLFKKDRDIAEGDSRVAFDSDAAIASINTQGYYLHSFEASFNAIKD